MWWPSRRRHTTRPRGPGRGRTPTRPVRFGAAHPVRGPPTRGGRKKRAVLMHSCLLPPRQSVALVADLLGGALFRGGPLVGISLATYLPVLVGGTTPFQARAKGEPTTQCIRRRANGARPVLAAAGAKRVSLPTTKRSGARAQRCQPGHVAAAQGRCDSHGYVHHRVLIDFHCGGGAVRARALDGSLVCRAVCADVRGHCGRVVCECVPVTARRASASLANGPASRSRSFNCSMSSLASAL